MDNLQGFGEDVRDGEAVGIGVLSLGEVGLPYVKETPAAENICLCRSMIVESGSFSPFCIR